MKTNSFVQIKKIDSARQMLFAEVYVPMVPDSQGDFMSAGEIEKVAHNFMRRQRMYNVDTEHNLQKNDSCVIESFIARPGDPEFVPGSWVVGIHVLDPQTWKQVEKEEINALSMYGTGAREDALIEIEIPDDGIIKGDTHDFGGHKHQFFMQFDDKGTVLKGYTDAVEVNGETHSHLIKGGTITEKAAGHAHRYSLSDALALVMGNI